MRPHIRANSFATCTDSNCRFRRAGRLGTHSSSAPEATKLNQKTLDDSHQEIVDALAAIGNPALGHAIQRDRGSQLPHLGVRFPDLRRRVKQGFSFYELGDQQALEVWDGLWNSSPYGDVLFAALEYYAPVVRKKVPPGLWPVVQHWPRRVDNWCHSDGLSAIYSRIVEASPDVLFPVLRQWNAADDMWPRRMSLTSLVHYNGKNAVFLPLDQVLPFVSTCIADHRHYIELAVGWVLREMGQVYPDEVAGYLEENSVTMSAAAFSRAIERRPAAERARLRALRVGSLRR
jgi:3-methyladenine DNA glycosylase AlkD